MPRSHSFRIGKVTGYLRGRVWYLCYSEHGQRRRPRVGPDLSVARQLAADASAMHHHKAVAHSEQLREF